MTRLSVSLVLPVFFLVGCGSNPEPAPESRSLASSAPTEPSIVPPKATTSPTKSTASVFSKPAAPKAHYGKLTIDSVQQHGSAAELAGSTDLPDGSKLIAEIELYTSNPNATYIGNSVDVVVKAGKWSGTVAFPQVEGFSKGPHEAGVLFTPKAQTPDILALVGENGDRLKGPSVKKAFDFRVVDVSKRVRLSVAKRAVSMANPEAYGSEDPRSDGKTARGLEGQAVVGDRPGRDALRRFQRGRAARDSRLPTRLP